MSRDPIDDMLRHLPGQLPTSRTQLSEAEKDQLIVIVGGVLTAQNIIKSQNDYPKERIPFLFSSLDTQAVIDILSHDMNAAIARAHALRLSKKASKNR